MAMINWKACTPGCERPGCPYYEKCRLKGRHEGSLLDFIEKEKAKRIENELKFIDNQLKQLKLKKNENEK